MCGLAWNTIILTNITASKKSSPFQTKHNFPAKSFLYTINQWSLFHIIPILNQSGTPAIHSVQPKYWKKQRLYAARLMYMYSTCTVLYSYSITHAADA